MTHIHTLIKNTDKIIMPSQKATSILLIDDSESTNFFNKMIIEKTIIDACVTIATNGLEALEILKKLKEYNEVPDLIFLDINMPIMDGWEFLEQYKNTIGTSEAPTIVLMIGAELNSSDRGRIQELGLIKGFSQKMLKKEVLLNLVNMHL